MSILQKIKKIIKYNSAAGKTGWPNYHQGWVNDFPAYATVKDIYFCFRLILGRNPNKEEWSGHSNRAGEPLKDIVQTYFHSQEFNNRNMLERFVPENIQKAQYENFEIYAARDDVAVGKHVLAGNYESDVTQAFKNILKPGMGVIDIGANIGYYSLLSSSLVGSDGWVMAVEPNSENIKFIAASRRLNRFDHLQIIHSAASINEDIMVLRNDYSNGTCSFLPEDEAELFSSEIVGCLRIDKLVSKQVDLIKIDIEGGELLAVQGCIDLIDTYRPAVIFEFSPPRIIDKDGKVSWETLLDVFFSRNYELFVIKPGGQLIPCQNHEEAYNEFDKNGVDHIDLLAKFRKGAD